MKKAAKKHYLVGRFNLDSVILAVAICCLATTTVQAQQDSSATESRKNTINSEVVSGASVFPESTVVYVEIKEPEVFIKKLLEHPMRDDIEGLTFVQKAMESDQAKFLPIVLGLIKGKTGMDWDELLETITQKGAFICVDEESGGAALLIHSGSEEKLKEASGMLLGMIKSDAVSKGGEAPYELSDYRNHKVAKFDAGILARVNDWLLISNKPRLAKAIADNLIDGNGKTLADRKNFVSIDKGTKESDLWAFIDLEAVREKQIQNDLFKGKTDNAFAELLVGGILEALNKSSQAIVAADLSDNEFKLSASMPFDSSASNEFRAFFFGPAGNSLAPKRLAVADAIADVVAYRDIAAWWNSKEDLFDENVIAQLAQADSQLSTLFGGLDFGEDVLGQLKPGVQIVAKPQTFGENYQPDIKLPSFAIVGRLEDPALQRRLKQSYRDFLGLINYQLGMEGQPQLESESESWSDGRIEYASYLIDDKSPNGLIHYNFSPSLAFQGEYMILSSTRELADELIASAKSADANAVEQVHTGMWLQADEIAAALKNNREALIVQNMIEDGNNREDAEIVIDGLLEVVDLFKSSKLEFTDRDRKLSLDIHIEFNGDRATAR